MTYTSDLERHIIELIKEQQIKLGYVKETVRLYFPKQSLQKLMGIAEEDTSISFDEHLNALCQQMLPHLGEVRHSSKADRYAISIPPKGCEFVHRLERTDAFLEAVIELFKEHNVTIVQVKELFGRFDPNYHCEEVHRFEFDYVLSFEDKSIDPNYYCVKFDRGHSSYHRFNEHDIQEIIKPD